MIAALVPVGHAAETMVLQVNGMVCAFCAQGIERKLRKQAQTQDVYVNLGRRVVAVELKHGQSLSVASLKTIIEDAGYEVVATHSEPRGIDEIKAAYSTK
jgi:periplasmic mercuric ion binding protein